MTEHRKATLEEAQALIAKLSEYFRRGGWLMCLYGSTLTKQSGKDIDLMLVNWREHPQDPRMLLHDWFGNLQISTSGPGLFSSGNLIVNIGGLIVDMQWRVAEIAKP